MQTVAARTLLVDVEHLGNPSVIGACLLDTDAGLAIVDPGPGSTLATLKAKLARQGLSVDDVRALLLTHIHLDHAGGTGSLVKENPRIRVYVHERGAPHMIDPAKLLASAQRLYGDQMGRLWGEFLPVPAENVEVLTGGEKLSLGNRRLEVAYTPGHAWHHVSYLDAATGIAFVGDTTGVRIANRPYVFPVTPPPDIDLEVWEKSLASISAWRSERLFLTHFGPAEPVAEHLATFRERLARWSQWVRASLENGESDEARAAQFARDVAADLRAVLPDSEAFYYERGGTPDLCWYGLARYWRKRAA